MAQLVLAVEYLHSHTVMHRQIRPETLLINTQGNLRLIGFDYAKVVPDRTFTMCGTPDYMSPEQLVGKGYGLGVDWWMVGITMFELLVG